jgi:hypothetical protein
VLAVMVKKHPVAADEVKKWIESQTGNANATPKAHAVVDLLVKGK